FPPGQVLAQALRPFPQFQGVPTAFNTYPVAIPVYWNPMANTWNNALREKVTQRLSLGLTPLTKFPCPSPLSLAPRLVNLTRVASLVRSTTTSSTEIQTNIFRPTINRSSSMFR